MLLTVHNLPPDIDYANIKRIIKELCFFNVLLINLQEVDDGSKKVTVSTVDANEAAIILRKLNSLEIEGYKLKVELGIDTEKERSPSPSYEEKRRLNAIYNEYIKQIEPLQVPSPPRISSPSISTRLDNTSSGLQSRRRSHSKSPLRYHKSRSRSPYRRNRSNSRPRGYNSRRLRQSRSRTQSPCNKQISKFSKRRRKSRSPRSRRKRSRSRSPRARKIRSRSRSRNKDKPKSMSRSPPRNKRKSNRRRRGFSPCKLSEFADNDLSPNNKVDFNITASNDIERESVVSARSEDNKCVIDESIIYAEFNETRIVTEETTIVRPNNTKSNDEIIRDDFDRNTELIFQSITNKPCTSNEAITVLHKTAVSNDRGHRNPYHKQNISDHEQNMNSFRNYNTATAPAITPFNHSNSKVIVTSNVLYDHKMIASRKEQTKNIQNQTHRNNFRKIPFDQNIVHHKNRFPVDFQSNNYSSNFIDGPFESRFPTNMGIANNQMVPNTIVGANFAYRHERPPTNADINNSYPHNNYRHNIDPFNNGPPQHVMTAINRNDPRNNYMQAQRNAGPPVYNVLIDNKFNNDNNPNRNQYTPANSNFDHHQGIVGQFRGPFNESPQNYMPKTPIPEGNPYNHMENSWNHQIRNPFMNFPPNSETGVQINRNMPILHNIRNPQGQEHFRPRGPLSNDVQFSDIRFKNDNLTTDVLPNKLDLEHDMQHSILPNSSETLNPKEVTINTTIIEPNKVNDNKSDKLVSNSVHNESNVKETAVETKTESEATIGDELDSKIAQNIKLKRKKPALNEKRQKERSKYDAWKEKQSEYFVNQKDTISSEDEREYFNTVMNASKKLNNIIIQATPKKHPSRTEYEILSDYIADKLHKLLKNKPNVSNINEYNILKENLYEKLTKIANRTFLTPLEPTAEEYVSIFLFEHQEESHREFMETYYKWCSEVFYLTEEDHDIICVKKKEKKETYVYKSQCQKERKETYVPEKNTMIKRHKKKNRSGARRNKGQRFGAIRLESYKRPPKNEQNTTKQADQITAEANIPLDETKATDSVDIIKENNLEIQLDQLTSNLNKINSKESTATDEAIDTESIISKFEYNNEKYRTENQTATHASILETNICDPDSITENTACILNDTTLDHNEIDPDDTIYNDTDSELSTSDPDDYVNQTEKAGREEQPLAYDNRNEIHRIKNEANIKREVEQTDDSMKTVKKKKKKIRSKVKKRKLKRSGRPRNRGRTIGNVELQKYARERRTSIESLIEVSLNNEDNAIEEDTDTPNQLKQNTEKFNPPINFAIDKIDKQVTEVQNDISEQIENLNQIESINEVGYAEINHVSERNFDTDMLSNLTKRKDKLLESMEIDIRKKQANNLISNDFNNVINPTVPLLNQENTSNHQIENANKNSCNTLTKTPNIYIEKMDTESITICQKINLKEHIGNKAPIDSTADYVTNRDTSDNNKFNIETISSDKTLNNPPLDQRISSDVSISSAQIEQSKIEEKNLQNNNSKTLLGEKAIDKDNQQNTELQSDKINNTNRIVTSTADRIVYTEESIGLDVIPDDEIKTEILDEVIDQQDGFQHPDWPIKIETEEYVETFYELQAQDSVQMPKPLSE